MDIYTRKTIDKVKRLYCEYIKFLYEKAAELPCEISEIPAPDNTPEARAKCSADMPAGGWHTVNRGDKWGEEFSYAWFRSEYTVKEELAGKKLLIRPDTGLVEGLLFIDNKPCGIFDVCPDIPSDFRLHDVQPLTLDAKAGATYKIAIECYAGHKVIGTRPYENGEVDKWSFYPASSVRTFNSLDIVVRDETVAEFLTLHREVTQIIDTFEESTASHAAAVNAFCEIFKILPLLPKEVTFDWHPALEKSNELLRQVTDRKSGASD